MPDLLKIKPPDSPGALIVLCDADTLRQQGHAQLFDLVEALMRPHEGPDLRVRAVQFRHSSDIEYWSRLAQFTRYDAVFVLAHGGPDGLVAAANTNLS